MSWFRETPESLRVLAIERAQLEKLESEAEARYRHMTGMDLPLADRAARARSNLARMRNE